MYFGFSYRTELIRQNMPDKRSGYALEIGVGPGHSLTELSGYFGKIYGFDISEENIRLLQNRIKKPNVHLAAVDLCSGFDKKYEDMFDFVYSADTLEHVKNPDRFFGNIARLLKKGATALILFPNESKDKYHGITCFDDMEDLLKIVPPGLSIKRICEVKNTEYFDFILNHLWLKPRRMINVSGTAQKFDETAAYALNVKYPFLAPILQMYPAMLLWAAKLGKMFEYAELKSGVINDKYLLMEMVKK